MNRSTLDKPRQRRDASKVLGIALQSRYRKLLEATGEDEIVVATGDLAQCMYENVEFVIWALKSQGGMNPPPPEELRRITPPVDLEKKRELEKRYYESQGTFAKPPEPVLEPELPTECTCPPLEPGIIGYQHMASCPKFVPA